MRREDGDSSVHDSHGISELATMNTTPSPRSVPVFRSNGAYGMLPTPPSPGGNALL